MLTHPIMPAIPATAWHRGDGWRQLGQDAVLLVYDALHCKLNTVRFHYRSCSLFDGLEVWRCMDPDDLWCVLMYPGTVPC